MAVITRSIPAVPYQGGTPLTVQPYSAAVQLTPTRMVWTYCQTNPAWRFFTIVDTPEGYVNGGTPTVTVARMQDQRAYQGFSLNMVRLNDNAFAVFDLNGSGSSATWSIEVFEITSELEFKKTYSNLSYSGMSSYVASGFTAGHVGLKYANIQSFIPVKDNLIYSVEFASNNGNGSTVGRTISYDNTKDTSSSLTFGSAQTITNLGNAMSYAEMVVRPVPRTSTKWVVTMHGNNTSLTTAAGQQWVNPNLTNPTSMNTYNYVSSNMLDIAPTIATGAQPTLSFTNTATYNGYTTVYQSTSQQPITGLSTPYDLCYMSDTRLARINWQNAYFYGTTQATGNVGQGGGSFSYGTASANPLMAYPLSNDFIMLMDRTHFVSNASGPINIKIIRRDDSNFVSVSGGSTSGTGFAVTAPWIDTWRQDSRPRMLANGDLFWWGLDATTGNANLTWNILKNAS